MQPAEIADAVVPKTTCEDVISSCDRALDAKNKEIVLKDFALQLRLDQSKNLTEQVTKLQEERSAFYRNPWFLISVGLVTGLLLKK